MQANEAASAPFSTQEVRARRDARDDRLFGWLLKGCALLVLASLLGAAGATLWGGRDAFAHFGLGFLTSSEWNPSDDVYGALVPVFGTLITSFIALLVAVPISFGIALYLSEVAPPWLRTPVSSAIELLAGIPSIIYGMWGLFVFAPFFADHVKPWLTNYLGNQPDDGKVSWVAAHVPFIGRMFGNDNPFGGSVLTAGIVLAIMIIPFISSVMREVFQTVPTRLKESAYALGSSTWEVVWDIVLPYTRSAVIGGIFLGLGRALGETMAVTFIIGNKMKLSPSLLDPGASIASTIANQFGEAAGLQKSALMALAFLLFVVTFIVLMIARLMLRRLAHKEGR
ncbi:phosphate transport system permease protein [Dyella sp. SG562]|jgi:phosphate transport system permease protein|uniref:phosphate ABC transporter permease subunit PstC n=1 Tax=Dyella TaxID=231454 RepID=UPI001420AB30|nr:MULTISPECIES: phosphate ABC transporter permease subunit PstC [unclassified Dyella]NII73893.1 phosphate transport system permease protein [Dyella sp. SG562]NKJ22150.1 phosphate transport system permease protein [Dyella sp. SG609]